VSPLLAQAFAGLRSSDPDEFTAAVSLAVSFFEVDRFTAFSLRHIGAAAAPATAEELNALQHELERHLHENPRRPGAGAAIFALGKRDDPELRPLLAECLRAHLDGDPDALYQALIALENQGEAIPWPTDVQSIRAVAENRAAADDYLLRSG
jgi:hypothetical protein